MKFIATVTGTIEIDANNSMEARVKLAGLVGENVVVSKIVNEKTQEVHTFIKKCSSCGLPIMTGDDYIIHEGKYYLENY